MEMLIKVHDIDEWLHPTAFYQQVTQLMKTGYSLDFVSDKMVAQAAVHNGTIRTTTSAPEHQVLIVPKTRYMPLATLGHLLRLANEGATVIFQQLPEDVPGLHDVENRRQQLKKMLNGISFSGAGDIKQAQQGKGQILLSPDVQKALEHKGIRREVLTDTGLKFIRRSTPDGKYYYLVNHTPKPVDAEIPLNIQAQSVTILDPQTGNAGLAASMPDANQTKYGCKCSRAKP